MNSLQNYILFSSDRGGMRIEYAKHKMGENTNAGLMNNNIQNNMVNNCNAGQNQLANSIQGGHVQTGNNLNNVPCTTSVTTIANNHHVNHVNHVNHVQHAKAAPQANSVNNLNSIGPIVNCNTPITQLTNQQNSVVIVGAQEATNQNGGAIITQINTNEQMEIVPSIEQCQYTMLVNYANRSILSLI